MKGIKQYNTALVKLWDTHNIPQC